MAPDAQTPDDLEDEENFYPTTEVEMAETDAHRCLMNYAIDTLEIYYAHDPMIYVSGNNLLFDDKTNLYSRVSPDCYVVYGVPKQPRNDYKIWKENDIAPRVVIDIISDNTLGGVEDSNPRVYANSFGIEEYFRFHLKGRYSEPLLLGFALERGKYIPLPMEQGDRFYSRSLGLYLVMMGEEFRFYNPRTDEYLRTAQEEIARLRAELENLKQSRSTE